jgi:pSer/pThr/pTyr-binding forkhead associated (FHA) protein
MSVNFHAYQQNTSYIDYILRGNPTGLSKHIMSKPYVKIIVMNGPDDGEVFELENLPIIIGRHSTDDVRLASDKRVSRHHARITYEEGSYFIEDVGFRGYGSTNGTYLNTERITQKKAINPGDVFALGTVILKFDIVSDTNNFHYAQ